MSTLLQGLPPEGQAEVDRILGDCPTVALRAGATRTAARLPASALLVVEEGVVLLTSVRDAATSSSSLPGRTGRSFRTASDSTSRSPTSSSARWSAPPARR